MAQEALERARQLRQDATANARTSAENGDATAASGQSREVGNGGVLELDPATFLASLDPQLRQTVLLEQGEEMIGGLPPDLLAE